MIFFNKLIDYKLILDCKKKNVDMLLYIFKYWFF